MHLRDSVRAPFDACVSRVTASPGAFLVLLLAACHPHATSEEAPRPDVELRDSALAAPAASASTDVSAPPVLRAPAAWKDVCSLPIVVARDAGCARDSEVLPLDVTFRALPRDRGFQGTVEGTVLVEPLDAAVPIGRYSGFHQCCTRLTGDAMAIHCFESEASSVHTEARVRRRGDALAISWCTADETAGEQLDRGSKSIPLPCGAQVRLTPTTPACIPRAP